MTQASSNPAKRPAGYLTFTLHAHLPYVVNHGTWPHGMEWLHEAAAETYLPMLRMLHSLERDSIRFQCNLNLSPILLEQLAHPCFTAEFPNYLNRKILAAREDEAYFVLAGELEVIVGDEKFILRAGDSLMAPRGIPHQLRNSGDAENHYLLVFSPAGFEEFVRITALPAPDDAIAPTEPPAVAVRNVHELAAEYGIQFD